MATAPKPKPKPDPEPKATPERRPKPKSAGRAGSRARKAPPRMVVLLHELPDGSSHFDWMIEGPQRIPAPPSPEDRCLITFRTAVRPDEAAAGPAGGTFEAERLADHRRAYLDFEGPLTDNRGHVRRLASGTVEALLNEATIFRLRGRFAPDSPPLIWEARSIGGHWTFESGPAEEQQ